MLRRACKKEKFKLNHRRPEDFTRCYWQKQPYVLRMWLVYRLFLPVFFFIALVLVLSKPGLQGGWYKEFILYTKWAFVAQLVVFTLTFVVTLERFLKERKDPELPPMEEMPLRYKILWALYTISGPSAIFVSIVFWLFIFTPGLYPDVGYTLLTHLANSVFMVADIFLYAVPYRFVHVYLPVCGSSVYCLFSILYYLCGGTGIKNEPYIYDILDWRNPKTAISSCLMQLTCIGLIHCGFCVMDLIKIWMKKQPAETEATTEEERI